MKSILFLKATALIIAIFVTACGNSSKNTTDGEQNQQKNRIEWEKIGSEFNPSTFEENFQTNNTNRIYIDMFSFKDDFEIVYTNTLATGQGYLKIYTVYKDGGSSGNFNTTVSEENLLLNRYGTYQCSIKTSNGSITQLKGLCFVRLQIYLPTGSEIEVYNIKQLISRRFIPIDYKTFIKNFKNVSFSDQKNAAIDEYLSSYAGLSKTPQLTPEQLGTVIDGFNWSKEKFEALRKLQAYVIDRQNLVRMIESEFSHFDIPEAKRICGF